MIIQSLYIIKLYLDSEGTVVTISFHSAEKSNSGNFILLCKAILKGPYNQ